MKLIALGLAAATSVAAALSATPASAGGVYFGIDDGYGYHHRPPPPPRVYYRPRPDYYETRRAYYDDGYDRRYRRAYARPERVCDTQVRRSWGPYGPVTKRIETCSDDD